MDAVTLLTTRQSTPRLQAPAPSGNDLDIIKQAALRAPDHAGLTPWQFIVYDNEDALKKLGEIYADAAVKENADVDQAVVDRAKELPLRAPLLIVCVAKVVENPKVPRVEQVISAGCGVMAMQQAAFALGYGGIWRTGSYAFNPFVKDALGISRDDEIVGFLYLGTPVLNAPEKPGKNPDDFFVAG